MLLVSAVSNNGLREFIARNSNAIGRNGIAKQNAAANHGQCVVPTTAADSELSGSVIHGILDSWLGEGEIVVSLTDGLVKVQIFVGLDKETAGIVIAVPFVAHVFGVANDTD